MAETVIERAAKALDGWQDAPCYSDNPDCPGGLYCPVNAKEAVRAVLTAIREPSDEMVKAGNASKPYNVDGYCEGTIHPVVQRAWPAMIDAALAEEV